MTIKYFAYVRKSTEGNERQALSIDSQRDKVKEIHPNLDIVEVLEEKHSAFKPYNRPVFESMIKRIRKGEAQGIIAWHPDRLSRNEIDASTITYLVRTGIIYDLKFASYNFDNSPEGIMMLQLALSQSQYFSSKLGKDVKRGLEHKIKLGWLPGLAPEGYLNDMRLEKGQRTIIIDKKRFPILRKAFDLFLTGTYSANEVLEILNNEWGYKTRKKKKEGGKSLSRTVWYTMLSKPFYAGIIVYNGIESKGRHKPLITIDEYNRIQKLLGERGGNKKPSKRNFTFAGMFKCGVCGCSITAEHKNKFIKCEKKIKEYDYYHCTHKKKKTSCKEKSIEEKIINNDIVKKLTGLKMHPIFLEWALEYLDKQKEVEKTKDSAIEKSVSKKTKDIKKEISGLNKMRARDLLDDEEYLEEKTNLKNKLSKLQENTDDKINHDKVIELTKDAYVFSAQAYHEYNKGDKKVKREILNDLGSNRKIKDKKVLILVQKWLMPIYKRVEIYNAKLARLEPLKFGYDYNKNEALNRLRTSWLRGWDSNPRPIDYTYPKLSLRRGLYHHPD